MPKAPRAPAATLLPGKDLLLEAPLAYANGDRFRVQLLSGHGLNNLCLRARRARDGVATAVDGGLHVTYLPAAPPAQKDSKRGRTHRRD